jgi:hypothetical protein
MLTAKELCTLTPGDVIEAGTVFQGMTKEPLKLLVLSSSGADGEFQLSASGTYFGIAAGFWRASVKDGKVIWRREIPNEGKEAA